MLREQATEENAVRPDARLCRGRRDAEVLRMSDEFSRGLMDATPDCVKVLDLDGRVLHMNTPGLCAKEIDDFGPVCGREWQALWPAEARGDIERSVTRAVGGEVSSFQAYCPTVKGTPKWWEVTVSPVRDEDGQRVVRLLAVLRDVTERKQGEDRLRASEAEFRAAFEQSAVGKAQISAQTRRFVRMNAKYCQLAGYSAEELAGVTPADLTFAVRDADGHPDRTMAVIQDITARKHNAAELQSVNVLLDTLLHTAPIGFCFLDRDLRYGRIIERLAEMNGIAAQAHLGRHVSEIVPTLVEAVRDVTGRILETGEAVLNHEFSGETPAEPGVTRFWSESWYPVRVGADEVFGFGVIVEEITARKRAEVALEMSEQFTRRILDNLFAFVGVLTTQGVLIEANRAPLEAAAISPDEVLGKKFWDTHWFSHSPQLQSQLRDWCGRAAAGEVIRRDITVRMAGDTPMWIDFQLAPLRDAAGRITHLIPSAMDISARREIEAALRSSEEFNRTVLESNPDCVKVLDGDGRLQFMNANGCGLTEIDDFEAVRGRPWSDLWPSEAESLVRDAVAKAVRGERARFQAFAPTAKGTPKWWDVIVAPALGRPGGDGALRLVSVSRDITDRKAAEDALRQNAALFSRLVEQAPMGMYVVDAEFRLQQVNALAAPVFATVDPLIGRDFAEIMQIVWGPEVGTQCTQIFRHTLATGERYVSPPFSEQRFDLAVEQAFEWETQRVTLPDGRHGVVCYFHEITARQRAERALHESEEHMRMATETTGVGIWEWNFVSGRIRWDAQMFRIYGIAPTPDGFVSYEDWSGCVLPEELARQEELLQDTLRKIGDGSREFRIRRQDDGQCRSIRSMETVRADAQGQVHWVVGTSLDVTAQRQMEEDLNMAARRKDEFLATLAHELRNPLAPLRNGLHLMKLAGGQQATTVEQARSMMERQLTQMVRLVDELMDVSRISLGKLELRKERLPLAAVVNSAVETSRPLIEQMGHELSVTLPKQPIMVDADMTRLAQVFLNLLNNAAKYSDRGGHIRLNVELQGSEVVVAVTDTGIGIDADQLPRIFAMFTQLSGSLERSQGGLGIGLSLVKRLVDMHGGSVEAKSEGRGMGSEFVVRLPVATEASQPQSSGVADEPAATKPSLRILIVDDNRDGADSLSEMLKMMGNDTRTAYDGQQGVDLAGEYRPNVILLDIGLPKLNGYEACRLIREQPKGKGVVLIAVTGWGQDEDRRRSREAGFDHHMVKPVDPQDLMRMLAGLDVGHE